MTTRRLLQPYYTEVDRVHQPKNFIMASKEEFNDILNNFRVPLGRYQFKRCLFAREYLYPGDWSSIYSFGFSRNPLERCVSMFHYLFYRGAGASVTLARISSRNTAKKLARRPISALRIELSQSYAFDVFLDFLDLAILTQSVNEPLGVHFSTHTAAVWHDITDDNGQVIITQMFRLENLNRAINHVFEQCGIKDNIQEREVVVNSGTKRSRYKPNKMQIARIETIYANDFEIYERAC